MKVADILKQAPVGTKLWSNLFGEVRYIGLSNGIINVSTVKDDVFYFYYNGKHYDYLGGECTLWPSKDHRAWDDEAYEILGIEKKSEAPFGLQPFDKVLVRDDDNFPWSAGFFLNVDNHPPHLYKCINYHWEQCIPYNEETKHLLGTIQMPPEKYRK